MEIGVAVLLPEVVDVLFLQRYLLVPTRQVLVVCFCLDEAPLGVHTQREHRNEGLLLYSVTQQDFTVL